jgi:hypothetical protein
MTAKFVFMLIALQLLSVREVPGLPASAMKLSLGVVNCGPREGW